MTQSRPRMTEQELLHVAALHEMGLTPTQIAEAVERPKSTINRTLNRLGYARLTDVTEADRAEWVRRYTSGESAASIARDVGRDPGTVYANLKRAGVTFDRSRKAAPRKLKTHCKHGHDLEVYGGPNYRRGPQGEWIYQSRFCRACTYVRDGLPLPTPERVASTNEKTHAAKAAHNASLGLSL